MKITNPLFSSKIIFAFYEIPLIFAVIHFTCCCTYRKNRLIVTYVKVCLGFDLITEFDGTHVHPCYLKLLEGSLQGLV